MADDWRRNGGSGGGCDLSSPLQEKGSKENEKDKSSEREKRNV